MEKAKRLAIIAKILNDSLVGDQETLRKILRKRGIKVSQASLSRDLKDLGAQRSRTSQGVFAYRLPDEKPSATSASVFRRRFCTSVTGVRRAEFIVLLFTPPGEAQLVGRLLDTTILDGLAGTVAGDDTVLCIADNTSSASALEKKFKEMTR
jgi:transcriptional regulator of arginine metabolism